MKYLIIMLLFTAGVAEAQTKVVVRARAKDAKFIGSSIGGAKVIIKDVDTGELLDEGMISGSTGNTKTIMQEPHLRYSSITDDVTAKYEANLDIDKPRFVEITVIAPVNQKQAAIKATTQLWVIPGEDITGEGIILEIPGFVVNVLSPQTHESVTGKTSIEIKANVVMMCGCTITAGGLWDANKMTVNAIVNRNGSFSSTIPLHITEKDNTFAGTLENPEAGLFEIIIYAFDSRTGNSGVDKVNIIVK